MTTRYKQWTPEEFEQDAGPSIDPLSDQVASAEDRDVLRDPEADAAPEIIRVGNTPPQPVPAFVDHGQLDPSAPAVDQVSQRGHLDAPAPSTDVHSDDMLDRVEGVPHHPGILRRRDARGQQAFSIRYRDQAGNVRTQAVNARTLDAADQALAEALLVDGREPIR